MSNPFESFANIFKIQAVAIVGVIIGIITGMVLGLVVSWQAGLITGLVIAGISVVYAVVAGARAAKSAFTGVASAAGEVFTEVNKAFAEESERLAPTQDFGYGLRPPRVPSMPDLSRYGVVQNQSPAEYFAKQREQQTADSE